MKVLGLIVEYNPFHNGHSYHMEQSRVLCGADCVVCVMSGNFIQRGEPAIVNKWARTKMALLSGADLVIELPVVYAMASAEFFAFGAVKILDSLGLVDYICFGSESGKLDDLDLIADVLCKEPEKYRQFLKEQLGKGMSYPAARENALSLYFSNLPNYSIDPKTLMGTSNNILGIEYLKAIKKLNSKITPLTIKRVKNSYNSTEITGSISSATSIRKRIMEELSNFESKALRETLPDASLSILDEEFRNGRGPVFSANFECIILSLLRKTSAQQIKTLPYIAEGLENRIKASADNCGSLDELIERTSTRRYTRTRIQRALFSLVTGLTSSELEQFNNAGGPQYIRVLGFNQRGRQLLSEAAKSSRLPFIVKAADFKHSKDALIKRMLEIEALSTDLYVLAYSNPKFRTSGQEYTQNLIRI